MPSPYLVNSNSGVALVAARAWALGERMVPGTADVTANVAVARQYVWTVTTAGTCTGTPAWPATVTPGVTTVTQNGVVWTASDPGYDVAGNMSHAHATPYLWRYAMRRAGAGELIYVSNTHNAVHGDNFSEGTTNGTNAAPIRAISVTFPGDGTSMPTAYTPGAQELVFPSAGMTITHGGFEFYGISLGTTTTSGTSPVLITLTNSLQSALLQDGELIFSNVANQALTIGGTNTLSNNQFKLVNYGIRFANGTSRVALNNGRIDWTGAYVSASGSQPTTQVFTLGGVMCLIRVSDSDLSNIGSSCALLAAGGGSAGEAVFENIKTPVGWATQPHALNNTAGGPGLRVRWINVGNQSFTYQHGLATGRSGGWVTSDSIFRNSLAGPEAKYSLVCTTTNQSSRIAPLEFDYSVDLPVGGTYTLTVSLATNGVTLTAEDVYLDVSVGGEANSPLGVVSTTRPAPMSSPTNLPTSSEAWTGVPGTPVLQRVSQQVVVPRACRARVRLSITRKSSTIYVDPAVVVS